MEVVLTLVMVEICVALAEVVHLMRVRTKEVAGNGFGIRRLVLRKQFTLLERVIPPIQYIVPRNVVIHIPEFVMVAMEVIVGVMIVVHQLLVIRVVIMLAGLTKLLMIVVITILILLQDVVIVHVGHIIRHRPVTEVVPLAPHLHRPQEMVHLLRLRLHIHRFVHLSVDLIAW